MLVKCWKGLSCLVSRLEIMTLDLIERLRFRKARKRIRVMRFRILMWIGLILITRKVNYLQIEL